MPRLTTKVALITGAAQGIGLAISRLFIQEGAQVILTDINDKLGQQEADLLSQYARYTHLDVFNEQQWQQVTKIILATFSHLDIVINNAGITGFMQTAGPHDPEHLDLNSMA